MNFLDKVKDFIFGTKYQNENKTAIEKAKVQNNSDNDNNIILEIITGHIRVINESIDIARKSKNLDTTNSRLDVAREVLNEAKKLASQYSLNVNGFNEAEAEIERIADAVIVGAPKIFDGMREIEPDPMYSTPSRNLLKEATSLKKEKKYLEACDKLLEAYSADGADMLMIEERLRFPMYLQLAGKNDEGWTELNKLLKKHNDQFSNQVILKQMQIFLKKENNFDAKNPIRITEIVFGGVNVTHDQNTSNPIVETKAAPPFEIHSNNPTKAWEENQDIIAGLKFCATMQFRTPLRVLKRHGEIHSDINTEPPQIAHELWEGIWVAKIRTFRELGLDINEMSEGTMASPIGQIKLSKCLPFLIAIREIVELDESIDSRIRKLYERRENFPKWRSLAGIFGGTDYFIKEFFPLFIETIPNINRSSVDELLKLGIDTPNKLVETNDEALLAINGIGNAKLKTIRDYCAGITKNRDDVRLDYVAR